MKLYINQKKIGSNYITFEVITRTKELKSKDIGLILI